MVADELRLRDSIHPAVFQLVPRVMNESSKYAIETDLISDAIFCLLIKKPNKE